MQLIRKYEEDDSVKVDDTELDEVEDVELGIDDAIEALLSRKFSKLTDGNTTKAKKQKIQSIERRSYQKPDRTKSQEKKIITIKRQKSARSKRI